MRRRILAAIVGTTALASLVLTIPLAVFAARREHERTVREMSLEAQELLIELTRDETFDPRKVDAHVLAWNLMVGMYAPDGRRVAGDGPTRADEVTERAVYLQTNERVDGAVIVAQPVVVRGEKVGTLRLTEMRPETGRRITKVLVAIALFNVLAVVFAAVVGAFVAHRLARPVRRLRDDAVRLGTGDFAIASARSGIDELDETSAALSNTAKRLSDTLRREREFTANASHQLRTPLTSLRVLLEGEIESPRSDPSAALDEALSEVDRLQATITTMLDVARGQPIPRAAIDLAEWGRDLAARWASDDRPLNVNVEPEGSRCHISRAVVDQATDILVANARLHGRGDISIRVRAGIGRLVVEVGDEGRMDRSPADLFRRGDPGAAGNGLGLSLARSLVESEGGRLVLESIDPTTFRLSLPDHRPVDSTP
ncbi:MAG: HAMP domain-containing histidine kinase [Microthrixaceae bacterium]|nr:HAMP domain-containing histidine kinase [Microthrixaceae bacterium]